MLYCFFLIRKKLNINPAAVDVVAANAAEFILPAASGTVDAGANTTPTNANDPVKGADEGVPNLPDLTQLSKPHLEIFLMKALLSFIDITLREWMMYLKDFANMHYFAFYNHLIPQVDGAGETFKLIKCYKYDRILEALLRVHDGEAWL